MLLSHLDQKRYPSEFRRRIYSRVLRNCRKAMKKKSPDKGSSYNNLDSGEMQEIRTSSESWTKCSFIELLVTILVKTRGFTDSFYFHTRFSPDSSRNSQKDNKFVRNVSVFFLLFLLIPIYRSSNGKTTKQRDFTSTEIKKQSHSENDYIDKDIKNYLKLGGIFEPSWYKLQPFVEIVKVCKDPPFNFSVFHEKSLVYTLPKIGKYEFISGSNSHKYFFGSYLKRISNPDLFLLEKISLGYSINSEELKEFLVKSFLSLKKEVDPSLLNCIEYNSHRFLAYYYWYLSGVQQQQILAKNKCEYLFNQFVNSTLERNIDSILSIRIHQNPKFISRKTNHSNDWAKGRFLIKEFFGRNYYSLHEYIERRIKANENNKTSPVNLPKYYKYYFEWLSRVMQLEELFLNPGPIQKTLPTELTDLIFLKATKSCDQIPSNENGINNSTDSFSLRVKKSIGVVSSKRYTFNTFSQQLLINDFGINTITDRNFGRSLKEIRKFHYLSKFLKVRGVGISSLIKIQKYYSKLLLNFVLPFNPVYSICQQNFFENRKILKSRKIWGEQFLSTIIHRLLPIHLILIDSNIFLNKMKLNGDLKNKKSNLLMDLSQAVEDHNPSLQLLRTNGSENCKLYDKCKNEFINVYLSIPVQLKLLNINGLTRKRSKEYLSLFLNHLYPRDHFLPGLYQWQRKDMFLVQKAIVVKNVIRGVERYEKSIFIVFKGIHQIRSWIIFELSERFSSNKFMGNFESSDSFIRFIRKNDSKGFSEVLDFLRIPLNQFHKYNSSFKRSERYIDQVELNSFCFDWTKTKNCRLITPFRVRLNNFSKPFVLLPKSQLTKKFSVDKAVDSTLANSRLFADFLVLHKDRIKSKNPSEFFYKIRLNHFLRNIPVPKRDGKMVVKLHPDILRYVFSMRDMNMKMSEIMTTILLHLESDFFGFKDSKYKVQNRVPRGENVFSEYSRFGKNSSSTKLVSLDGYMSWFFTPEWWGYYKDLFLEVFCQIFSTTLYFFKYVGDSHIQIVIKKFENFWRKNLHAFIFEWKSEMFVNHTKEKIAPLHRCFNYRIIKNKHGLWAILLVVSFISFFKQSFFSILIGSNSLCLWKHFETIQYLTDTSRTFHSIQSIYHTREKTKEIDNLIIHVFENLKRCMRDIQFYILMNKGLDDWLITNKGLDLSRREKSPLVQSLITCARIERYGFNSYPKRNQLSHVSGYRVTNQQGFSYLRYLSRIVKKKIVNHPVVLTNKWIDLASSQKMIFSRTLIKSTIGVQQAPIPLQFGLSHAKGILLIGPIETGRSYLIKNSAANSRVPLLGIHMDKFLYNKPDVITESWINILIESLRGLNLILDLANEMSPCLIWIRNLHQLDVNRPTRNIESEPAFLLGILSKYFQTNPTKSRTKRNIIIIGSTHLPGKVDPALISADRLDRIINIRSSTNSWKKQHLFILLNTKNLRLKSELSYRTELDSKITGYSTRDLAALTNEVSLISIARNKSFVCHNTIELAFHRQILRFTHMSDKSYLIQNLEILFYKAGRAIAQNLLIESFTMNSLSITNYSWKNNFYHLAEWYLEPSVDKSIVKEFEVMIYALACLAGIAARDSWFLLKEKSDTSIALDRSIENDLGLASSILESIPIEFSRIEICEARFVTYKQTTNEVSLAMNSSNIIQHELFAVTGEDSIRNDFKDESSISRQIFLSGLDSELQSTSWSPRCWRLSFCRSHLFDWIKKPNDSESLYRLEFLRGEKNIISNDMQSHNNSNRLTTKGKQQFIYERILPRVRKRTVQELEFQLQQILLEEESEILGFRRHSTQYQFEYKADNKPRFFIGKRILWNPTGSYTRKHNPIFSRREFFVDEEILRRLYVTYGVRRERERSLFNHKIKRFFLRRGYNKELINKLSIRWWNQLPTHEEQSIDTWKRIEGIGVRLRRPQVFTPVYLYQRWLIENLPEKFPRFELLTHRQRWLGVANLLLANSFAYTTLLESYQYLLEFFSSKKILLNQAMKALLKKKWLLQNEIEHLIHYCGKTNTNG